MNILNFKQKKEDGEKIVMVTCYDALTQAIIEKTKVDCVLVGDTVSMVVHGFDNTTHATMDMMCMHVEAVARKQKTKFIIGDMPFLSYRESLQQTMLNVKRLITAGAHAIKLEGATGNIDTIQHIVDSGVPVMGHLGLTPQAIHSLGGNKVQGKTKALANRLLNQAKELEAAGVFALVLECVPSELAKDISKALSIPTIGIGAGPFTDGQVLVIHDLLGFQQDFKPKFLKHFMDAEHQFMEAIDSYAMEVRSLEYPCLKRHSYS